VILVVDASVVVKWLIADPQQEADLDHASGLVDAVGTGEMQLIQPVHWLAEVAGVLARTNPETLEADLLWLYEMELEVADTLAIYQRAGSLAITLNHHLFDTLYHAVALETPGATLVTADNRYLNKARSLGRIVHLSEWRKIMSFSVDD
jgi:predicted nucleic acid-binding protein